MIFQVLYLLKKKGKKGFSCSKIPIKINSMQIFSMLAGIALASSTFFLYALSGCKEDRGRAKHKGSHQQMFCMN